MTGDDFQMVYQDTPGVLTPAYMLHVSLVFCYLEAIADLMLGGGCVVDSSSQSLCFPKRKRRYF